MDYYNTRHLAALFRVSTTAIKNWSVQFSSYLSPSATPPAGQERRFTHEDASVFALVSDMKNRGYGWEDAHLALKAGQRGEVPTEMPQNGKAALAEPPQVAIQKMQDRITNLEAEVENLKQKAAEWYGQVTLLDRKNTELMQEIRELYRQLARLEAEGKH